MTENGGTQKFAPSGFFVLRAPLLPFDELEAWSAELAAPAAAADGEGLDAAVCADRARLQERLRAVWARADVREAVFLASPDLCAALDRGAAGDSGDSARAVRSFVSYFTRMAGRATPFGLFAGCGVGTVGRQTQLALDGR